MSTLLAPRSDTLLPGNYGPYNQSVAAVQAANNKKGQDLEQMLPMQAGSLLFMTLPDSVQLFFARPCVHTHFELSLPSFLILDPLTCALGCITRVCYYYYVQLWTPLMAC